MLLKRPAIYWPLGKSAVDGTFLGVFLCTSQNYTALVTSKQFVCTNDRLAFLDLIDTRIKLS